MSTSVVFEGSPGLVVDTPTVRVVAVEREDVVAAASRERDGGADRIELCGGFGPAPLAAVRREVGPEVPVGGVMFGFESLEATTDFKRRFGRGEAPRGAVLYLQPGADPVAGRVVRDDTAFVPVPDVAATGPVAASLRAEGVTLLELYAGLGPEGAAAALAEVEGRVAVGVVLFAAPDR